MNTQYTKKIDRIVFGIKEEMETKDWIQLAFACLDQAPMDIPQILIDSFPEWYDEMLK